MTWTCSKIKTNHNEIMNNNNIDKYDNEVTGIFSINENIKIMIIINDDENN